MIAQVLLCDVVLTESTTSYVQSVFPCPARSRAAVKPEVLQALAAADGWRRMAAGLDICPSCAARGAAGQRPAHSSAEPRLPYVASAVAA